MTQASATKSSRLRMHQGQAILKIAHTYGSLLSMILEVLQNAIDSGAQNIWLRIDNKKRAITVQDDGSGASIKKFEEALLSVCQTVKKKDKLGRFGIGLICPIGKCDRFLFTSSVKGERTYNQWEFVSSSIVAQQDDIDVPRTVQDALKFSRIPTKGMPWRTEMRIESFRADLRVQRDLEKERLTREVQDRFTPAMRKGNTVIHATIVNDAGEKDSWEIKPQEYRGAAIGEHKQKDRTGETVFRLYVSQRKGRGWSGRGVSIGEAMNDFRLDFKMFAQSNASAFLSDETIRNLQAGIFEGEILSSGIALRPDRVSFEQNTALETFCSHINTWVAEVGVLHVEEARSETRAERYQQTGIASLRALSMVFEKYPILAEIVSGFKLGNVGIHHSEVDAEAIEKQKNKSLSIHSAGTPRAETIEHKATENPYKSESKEGHSPLTVQGPKGAKRTLVKDDSVGLQFSYEGLEGSLRLYELDTQRGILTFNVRHPLWTQAEEGGDRGLMQFQEMIAIFALSLQAFPDTLRPTVEAFAVEDYFPPMVFLQVFGDRERGTHTIWKQPPAKRLPVRPVGRPKKST